MNTGDESPFGGVVFRYTRAQAVADGVQIDVTATAKEAGIRFPVFLTRGVFDAYVTVPPGVRWQDEAGRLWDIVWMLRTAMKMSRPAEERLSVELYVQNDAHSPHLVMLEAVCGPLDVDDPQPAVTVMLTGED